MPLSDFRFLTKEITIVLLVILPQTIVARNCLEMYKACDRAQNNCHLDIIIMKKMCGDFQYDDTTFNGCDRVNELNCKAAIKTLRSKHNFGDCTCETEYYRSVIDQRFCESILRMLHSHPCNSQTPLYLSRTEFRHNNEEIIINKPTEIELDKFSTVKNVKDSIPNAEYNAIIGKSLRTTLGSLGLFSEINAPRSLSCLLREKKCNQDQNCYNTWTTFKNQCQFQSCDKTGDLCVASYQELRQYGMFECICVQYHQYQTSNMNACLDVQTNLIDNKCLAFLNNRVMYQTLTFAPSDGARRSDPSVETSANQLQSLTKESPNCLSSYQLCMQSSQCLQRYIEVEKHCSSCTDNGRCLKAVRFFHQKPDIISLNSIRCQCDHSSLNESCLRQQRVFQPACVTKSPRPIINCLLLMLQCLNDTTCLDSYTVFSELCTPRINGTHTCPSTYIRCLDAYRTIWGSVLTSECSCDDTETINIASNKYPWAPDPLHVCQFFKNLLSRLYCIFPDTKQRKESDTKLDSSIYLKEEIDPCLMVSKHNLPSDGLIRIGTSSSCPVVCRCGHSCQTLPCAVTTNITFTFCDLFNLSKMACQCSMDSIKCSMFRADNLGWIYKDSGYKILIKYNEKELILIRTMNLVPGIQSIVSALNSLMIMSTGLKQCRLSFESVQDGYLTFILEINIQRTDLRNHRFSVRYWPQSIEERMGHLTAECVLSAKLLQLMINRNYPEIQHNLPLSILQKADIIVPPQLSQDSESVKSSHIASPGNSSFYLRFTAYVIIICQLSLTRIRGST